VWRLIGSSDATWKAVKSDDHELRFTLSLGVDRFQQKNELLFPPELNFEPVDDGLSGTSLFGTSDNLNLNTGVNAVYQYRPLAGGFTSTTSTGYQIESRQLSLINIVSRNLNAGQRNVDTGSQVNVTELRQQVVDRGFFVQEEFLTMEEKLMLAAAIRGEQSSVNGDPNKYYWFPKASGSYRLLQVAPGLTEVKLRAAYGETGNQPLYGQKFTGLNVVNNIEGAPGTIGRALAGDPNIRPERQREIEVGTDAILFNGDAVFEFSWYQRTITDLLLQRTLAPSTGFTLQDFNGGEMINRGVEVMAEFSPFKGRLLEVVSRTTFAANRGVVTKLPVPAFNAGGFGTGLGAFRIEEGKSITQIIGNKGFNADGSPNVVALGDTEPDFRMSFVNDFRIKWFRLHTMLEWQKGGNVINLTRFLYDLSRNSPDVAASEARVKAFTEDNLTATYIEDASFVKLREVTLSFDVPYDWIRHTDPAISSMRFSLSGRNLLTWTRYSGLDPEVSNFGNQAVARNIDVAPFPPSRSFWGSVEVSF
jgi:outer membrane receptor protein involved in Fe transport